MSQQKFKDLISRSIRADSIINSLENQLKQLQKNLKISEEKNSEINQKIPQKKNQRTIDILGARMKIYEEKAFKTKYANNNQILIVRLDGHCFSQFTKGFLKPFDTNLHQSMINTVADLIKTYNANTGYTQSDEITLIYNKCLNEKDTHIFNGRINKISSVLASYASIRFNYHLNCLLKNGVFNDINIYKNNDILKKRIESYVAHFDGRSFNVPNNSELINNIMWRCHFDCSRNSISSLARYYYTTKELHNKSSKQKIDMLLNEKNIDWYKEPLCFRYGTFVKKELYIKKCIDIKTNKQVNANRTRICSLAIEMDKYDDKWDNILIGKYWDWTNSLINQNNACIIDN